MKEKILNPYQIMWIFVAFDLPTDTKTERREASLFRNNLLKLGCEMYQFSIYLKSCSSLEKAKILEKNIEVALPSNGNVVIIKITDKQFSNIKNFKSRKRKEKMEGYKQISLF